VNQRSLSAINVINDIATDVAESSALSAAELELANNDVARTVYTPCCGTIETGARHARPVSRTIYSVEARVSRSINLINTVKWSQVKNAV